MIGAPTLALASLRQLLRHPAQLALALIGLALGVATIVAVDIAAASAGRAFELSVAAVNGPATHEITGGPGGVGEGLFAQLYGQSPMLELAPVVEGYVTVGERALQLVGVDPLGGFGGTSGLALDADATGSFAQLQRLMRVPGAAILSAATARQLPISADGAFSVSVAGREHRAQLIARPSDAGGGRGSLLLTDISQAQEWLGMQGRLSRITVRAAPGAAGAAALAALRAALPPGVELVPAAQRSRTSAEMTAAFTTNLKALSLLALLVGVFLVYAAVSFAVVQRRRTLSVLRALGATRRQILTLIMAESAALGAVGAVVGVAGGTLIGRTLIALVSRTINDLYFVVSVQSVTLPPYSVAKALGAGFATACIAALLPAIEASTSTPQLGMRRSSLERRVASAAVALCLVSGLCALGSGAILYGSSSSLAAGFLALLLLLLSVAALAPALLKLTAGLCARAAGLVSPVARVACADVGASLSRTGVAVAALALAVAAMIGVSVMVGSFRESLRDWLARTMRADIYVSAPGPGFARPERRLDPGVIAALLAIPGIAAHAETRRVLVDSTQGPITLDALAPPAQSEPSVQLTQGAPVQVWPAFARGALLLAEPLAARLHAGAGGHLDLDTPVGLRRFPIAGVFREYGNDRGAALINAAVYRRLWRDEAVTTLALYLKGGVAPAPVVSALYAAAAGRQDLFIGSNVDVRELSMDIFDRTFLITRVLYWLAAGVAAIGLASALLAWELERSFDLAVVRALGLTPRGAGLLIALQTLLMGAVALMAAVPAGLAAAAILVEVINRRAFGWQIDLHIHAGQLGNALALALAAALVAAVYPAWRSAVSPVATELRAE